MTCVPCTSSRWWAPRAAMPGATATSLPPCTRSTTAGTAPAGSPGGTGTGSRWGGCRAHPECIPAGRWGRAHRRCVSPGPGWQHQPLRHRPQGPGAAAHRALRPLHPRHRPLHECLPARGALRLRLARCVLGAWVLVSLLSVCLSVRPIGAVRGPGAEQLTLPSPQTGWCPTTRRLGSSSSSPAAPSST